MAPTQRQLKEIKSKQIAGAKAPKASVARYLKTLESKLVEEAKSVLLLKGIRCSDAMATVLKDIRSLKAPHSKLLSKNNVIVPFDDEGQQSLDFLCTKNDTSLFALASHNKKRPNNLTIGRTFDRRILDMCEIGVIRYKSLLDYAGSIKKRVGSKPMMLFVGDKWHLDNECKRLQNLLIDFYRGDPVEKLVVSGLDHIMVFTVVDDPQTLNNHHDPNVEIKPIIYQRTYFVKFKKNPNGGRIPLPYLIPCGPDMDFKVRRTQFATPETWKMAMKQPAATKSKKVKNHTTNIFGETIGRLHLERQDIDKMGGKKSKALRSAEKIEKAEQRAADEADLSKEGSEIAAEFKQTFGFDQNDMTE